MNILVGMYVMLVFGNGNGLIVMLLNNVMGSGIVSGILIMFIGIGGLSVVFGIVLYNM